MSKACATGPPEDDVSPRAECLTSEADVKVKTGRGGGEIGAGRVAATPPVADDGGFQLQPDRGVEAR